MNSRHRRHNRPLSLLIGLAGALLAALAAPGPSFAQGAHGVGAAPAPAAAEATLAQQAARRFPQPVRVGDLVDRQVLEPSNHQGVLGRVDGVERAKDGTLLLVVRYGGVLGLGTRPIAVPIDATTLLGPFMQIVGIPPDAVAQLPTFDRASATTLPPDAVIQVGINRN